ncbi:MAG: DNA-binding protein, partial [Flavobacteriaceae bacterium]|nr:DNA-binding protein [Flavobacteriaceae bacterium]
VISERHQKDYQPSDELDVVETPSNSTESFTDVDFDDI